MKQEFIKKWSSWWILSKQGKELTEAFEKELDAIINDELAKNISSNPILADSCQHDWDYSHTINVNDFYYCKKCGKRKVDFK